MRAERGDASGLMDDGVGVGGGDGVMICYSSVQGDTRVEGRHFTQRGKL